MPRRKSEEEDSAPPPPCFTTPTKAIRNDGACHAKPDAEGTGDESDADVEKEIEKSTGKKRNYTGYQKNVCQGVGHRRIYRIGGGRNSA